MSAPIIPESAIPCTNEVETNYFQTKLVDTSKKSVGKNCLLVFMK